MKHLMVTLLDKEITNEHLTDIVKKLKYLKLSIRYQHDKIKKELGKTE